MSLLFYERIVDFFPHIGYNKSYPWTSRTSNRRADTSMEFESDTNNTTIIHDELRPEYDLRKLRVRKFGPARKQFGNFIKLEPESRKT